MAARIGRAGHPLHLLRRTDDRVLGHGVVVGSMQVVRPLVDRVGPGFDKLGPTWRGRGGVGCQVSGVGKSKALSH